MTKAANMAIARKASQKLNEAEKSVQDFFAEPDLDEEVLKAATRRQAVNAQMVKSQKSQGIIKSGGARHSSASRTTTSLKLCTPAVPPPITKDGKPKSSSPRPQKKGQATTTAKGPSATTSSSTTGTTRPRPNVAAPSSELTGPARRAQPSSGTTKSQPHSVPNSGTESGKSSRRELEPHVQVKGQDPERLRWERARAMYSGMSTKKQMEFRAKNPWFDPQGFVAKEARNRPRIDLTKEHTGHVAVEGLFAVLPVMKEREEDYWPVPVVLDMEPETVKRRDETVERILKFLALKFYKDGERRTDLRYSRKHYRVVLAEKALGASIERYASAWRYRSGPEALPPDAVLMEEVRNAALDLVLAHKPLPGKYVANVDPPYPEYMLICTIYNLSEGYLLHSEQDRIEVGKQPTNYGVDRGR